jgi:hypothetical protein
MKAWSDLPGDDPTGEHGGARAADHGTDRAAEHAQTAAAIEAAGIDLDPPPPGSRRHDEEHPADHAHPHVHSSPGEPPVIGIVGAGAVGTALGVALSRGGWPIQAVASRNATRRERFRSLVDVTRVFADPEPILDEVELIILAVPDDAIGGLARSLRMYGGQAMIHTSGALGAEVLAPAMAAGTQIGAFHPLVAFADTERAVAALHGALLHLAYVPDPRQFPPLGFGKIPLTVVESIRYNFTVYWLPGFELLIVIAIVVTSLRKPRPPASSEPFGAVAPLSRQ